MFLFLYVKKKKYILKFHSVFCCISKTYFVLYNKFRKKVSNFCTFCLNFHQNIFYAIIWDICYRKMNRLGKMRMDVTS